MASRCACRTSAKPVRMAVVMPSELLRSASTAPERLMSQSRKLVVPQSTAIKAGSDIIEGLRLRLWIAP